MSKNPSEWAKVATEAVGAWPGHFDGKRSDLIAHMKAVWVGIVHENCPGLSLKELSELAGFSAESHTSAWTVLKRWNTLHWRERHGWLVLAESKHTADRSWASSAFNGGIKVVAEDKANKIRRESNELTMASIKRIRGHQHVG